MDTNRDLIMNFFRTKQLLSSINDFDKVQSTEDLTNWSVQFVTKIINLNKEIGQFSEDKAAECLMKVRRVSTPKPMIDGFR